MGRIQLHMVSLFEWVQQDGFAILPLVKFFDIWICVNCSFSVLAYSLANDIYYVKEKLWYLDKLLSDYRYDQATSWSVKASNIEEFVQVLKDGSVNIINGYYPSNTKRIISISLRDQKLCISNAVVKSGYKNTKGTWIKKGGGRYRAVKYKWNRGIATEKANPMIISSTEPKPCLYFDTDKVWKYQYPTILLP